MCGDVLDKGSARGESAMIEKIYGDRVKARGYGFKDLKQTPTWKLAYYAGDRLKYSF